MNDQKYLLPSFSVILSLSGLLTSFFSPLNAKIIGNSLVGLGSLLATILLLGKLPTMRLGTGTMIMVSIYFLATLAISIFYIILYSRNYQKLDRVQQVEDNPLKTYETYVSMLMIVLVGILGRILFDAIEGGKLQNIDLVNMTSIGYMIMVIVIGLSAQMYNVVNHYLTEGFSVFSESEMLDALFI